MDPRPGISRDVSDLPASRFFNKNLHQLSDYRNVVQGHPKSTKITPRTIPETKKTLNFQNMKLFQNHCIYHGLSISSHPLATPWAQKTHSDAGTQTYLEISMDFNRFWVLLGGPGVYPRTAFLLTFSTLPLSGDFWRAQGRQKTPTVTKMTIKWTPRLTQ